MIPRSLIAVSLVVVLGSAGAMARRHVDSVRRAGLAAATLSASVARGDLVLDVPHAVGAITLDGDTDDAAWVRPPGPARTGKFVLEDGKTAVPNSAARLVWGGDYLYLALYASDEDIESHTDQPDAPIGVLDDSFRIVFSRADVEYAVEVTPRALITDSIRKGGGGWDYSWNSDAHASREIDGSINDPKNMDEEWAVELAIPLESLGLKGEPGENLGMSIRRCDTPKRYPRVCAGWGLSVADRGNGRIVLR